MDDFWDDNIADDVSESDNKPELASNSNLPSNILMNPDRINSDNNLITGETFLKDARQIDTQIEQMTAMA